MRKLTWRERREQARIQREGWREMVEKERQGLKPGPEKPDPPVRKPPRYAREPYEYKTVRRNKDTQRLLRKGWELVDSSGKESMWSGSYKAIMRRPNPHYRGNA
ncbi:hypothetical protein GCM10023190_19910 [Enteractinococcus fodinae]